MDYNIQREVVVHVASYHANRAADYNERNLGVGLRLPVSDKLFAAVGVFENSLYRTSLYAGVGTNVRLFDHVALRLTVGGVTGYLTPVTPMLFPELVIGGKDYGVAVGFIPKLTFNGRTVDSVVSLSVTKRF